VARDACSTIGLTNLTMALLPPAEDEKGFKTIDTPGGPQRMRLVSEPGLYKLIQSSPKPAARAFDRWVRHEVLPSIRKTGSYALADHGRTEMPLPADFAAALLDPLGLTPDTAGPFRTLLA
jgi:anti-repressor protein